MSAHRWQENLFIALAVAGLIGTWAQALGYLNAGFLGGNIAFWKDTVTTPAATFIVVDLFVLGSAVFIFMFAEGRRLGIGAGWLWTYFLGSALIGISCFVPLFFAHRQRVLRERVPAENVAPAGNGLVAITLSVVLALGAVVYSLCNLPAH